MALAAILSIVLDGGQSLNLRMSNNDSIGLTLFCNQQASDKLQRNNKPNMKSLDNAENT